MMMSNERDDFVITGTYVMIFATNKKIFYFFARCSTTHESLNSFSRRTECTGRIFPRVFSKIQSVSHGWIINLKTFNYFIIEKGSALE